MISMIAVIKEKKENSCSIHRIVMKNVMTILSIKIKVTFGQAIYSRRVRLLQY